MLTLWLPQWGFAGWGPNHYHMEYKWPVARLDGAPWWEHMPIRAGYLRASSGWRYLSSHSAQRRQTSRERTGSPGEWPDTG